jgi:hypothetical protein
MVRRLWKKIESRYGHIYLYFLAQKGIMTKLEVILQCQLSRDIVRYYGRLLSNFRLNISDFSVFWATEIFYFAYGAPTALYHFLMMQYLTGSIQQFFKQLQQIDLSGTEISHGVYYMNCTFPNMLERDREVFRKIWMKKHNISWKTPQTRKHFQNISKRIDAFAWLYRYDYDWLADNSEMKFELLYYCAGGTGILKSIESRGVCSIPYRLSRVELKRFQRKVFIKSFRETRNALYKWRLSYCSGIRFLASGLNNKFYIVSYCQESWLRNICQ